MLFLSLLLKSLLLFCYCSCCWCCCFCWGLWSLMHLDQTRYTNEKKWIRTALKVSVWLVSQYERKLIMIWKESIVSLEDYHGINGGLWFFMQLKIQWTVACKSTLEICKEGCNSLFDFFCLFKIILRRQIKHKWIFFLPCHYHYSSSDIALISEKVHFLQKASK